MNKINRVVFKMLTENTGTHMLDSGSAYGRHWQSNQIKTLKDFKNESSVKWNGSGYTISVFHYLVNQLDIDNICEKFNKINSKADNWNDDRFYGVSKESGEYLDGIGKIEISEGFNTYNFESSLSQVLQGTHIKTNEKYYLLLQIHGGCDIRGGYTTARLFKLDNEYQYDIGYLEPESVMGQVNDVDIDNMSNGYSLTKENGEAVEIKEDSKVELYLHVNGCVV